MSSYKEITFSDSDVVNKDDFIPKGESNPHNVRPWLLHDHGFVLAVAFADCLQDAIDIAYDAGKLDRYKVEGAELADYGPDGEGLSYLGNGGAECDIESLGALELPNPKFSFCTLFDGELCLT